jgi:hypothetical protein
MLLPLPSLQELREMPNLEEIEGFSNSHGYMCMGIRLFRIDAVDWWQRYQQ